MSWGSHGLTIYSILKSLLFLIAPSLYGKGKQGPEKSEVYCRSHSKLGSGTQIWVLHRGGTLGNSMDHSELSCTLAPGPGWAYVCCWLGGVGETDRVSGELALPPPWYF